MTRVHYAQVHSKYETTDNRSSIVKKKIIFEYGYRTAAASINIILLFIRLVIHILL